MVLYLAREYKSAGVVSRIATTRKKVEGIKRCSLLFDRERRRFLFAKRAFSRFDVLAFVLLRLFSLSLFAIFFFCALIKSVSCRLVSSNKKKIEQQQNKEKERVWREEKLFPFFFFFSSNKEKNTHETKEWRERSPKKIVKKKSPPKPNKQQKEERGKERRKRESDCRFRFHLHHSSSRGALPLEVRESSSLASDTTLESARSSRNAFRGERERERERICAFFSKGERAILLSWKF